MEHYILFSPGVLYAVINQHHEYFLDITFCLNVENEN